jgi:hypothetical protein
MNMPRFTAEVSLYKTSQMYRGPRSQPAGDAGSNVVTQQLDCGTQCAITWQLCNIGCAVAGGPFLPFCLAACGVRFALCLDDCPSGGGGGGGGGGGCCPRGRRCCGSCESGKCDDVCVGPGQSCP